MRQGNLFATSAALFDPRYYQDEALVELRANYDNGLFRQLVQMATGTGKTSGVVMHLPQRFPYLFEHYGMAFMVHRREIVFDTYLKLRRAYPNATIGIEMGENHAKGTEDIIIFSVDSIGRLISNRIRKYRDRYFGIFVTDEAHHALPDSSYDNVLGFFGMGADDESHLTLPCGRRPLSVFLTATPKRHDERSIAPFLDVVAYQYTAKQAVRDGYLVDIRTFTAVPPSPAVLETPEGRVSFLQRIAQDHAKGNKTLVFARNVPESQTLADSLNANGIVSAGHVDANTDKSERTVIVDAFNDGDLELITNRLVYTEGWDSPIITHIFDDAPTESESLFQQKIGRGMRTHPLARVDDYDTAEERHAAIASSPKPYLTYVRTTPPQHGMTVANCIFDVPVDIEVDGKLVLEEVVDVIENVAEEEPERPIQDIAAELANAEVQYQEANVWTNTVYNEELKAITPLRWVITNEGANIYIPQNPMATRPYDEVPVIFRFEKRDDRYRFRVIEVGGWNPKIKAPRRAAVKDRGFATTLQQGISQIDDWLLEKHPSTFAMLGRGSNGEVTKKQGRYLMRHGIGYNEQSITEGLANILIEDHRIRRTLSKLDIEV